MDDNSHIESDGSQFSAEDSMDLSNVDLSEAQQPMPGEGMEQDVDTAKEKRSSIMVKFMFWFLIIALLPMVLSSYVGYDSARKVLREEVTNSLIAIANNKTNQIENFLQKKKAEIAHLTVNTVHS